MAIKKTPALRGQTREKIVRAAIDIFANYPYHAASLRMIGKAAGISHPLISYYFPSKSTLFENVLIRITDDLSQANRTWYEGLDNLSIGEGFSLYLDRLFAYAEQNRQALRIIAINLVPTESNDIIPGYHHIQNLFVKMRHTFQDKVRVRADKADIAMYTHNLNTLLINYLGAEAYYTKVLDIKKGGPEYLRWVKASMLFLFVPHLRMLIRGNTAR